MKKGWWGAFAALFVCSWAGNQFSPLLLLYKDLHGYSSFTVNAFLGVYVLGLGPGLLLAGALSDRHGRRPLMMAAIVFALAASVVLALGEFGAPLIYAGRLLAGITVGTAMAAGTSWLKELSETPFDPDASAGAGARRAAMAFAGGSAVGALVAGALAQWGPWPQVLPYVVHILVTLPLLAIVRRLPETYTPSDPAAGLWEDLRVPAAGHRRFRWIVLISSPWIFAGAGLAYGYVPVLLQDETQGFGIAYATLLTVVCLGIASFVQPAAKRLDRIDNARGVAVALIVLTIGIAGIAAVAATGWLWLGVLAAAVCGAGIGIGLSSCLLEVQRIAGPRDLAGLTAVFYAVAYLGFLAPTVLAAITPPFTPTVLLIALTVLALASIAVVIINSRRHLPTPPGQEPQPPVPEDWQLDRQLS